MDPVTGRKGNRSSYRKERQQVILQEGKATGHPTGRKGNRSSYRKERQQVILQEGKATGHPTGRKGNRSSYRKERQQVILQEGKATGHPTGRKGSRSSYRKERQQVALQGGQLTAVVVTISHNKRRRKCFASWCARWWLQIAQSLYGCTEDKMTHLVRVSEDCRTLRKYTVGKMTDPSVSIANCTV